MEEGGAHVGPPDCRASVPTHTPARGYAMPGFYDAAAADSPTAERAAGSGTPFPAESDLPGTGRACSPTPQDSLRSGRCPDLVTQKCINISCIQPSKELPHIYSATTTVHDMERHSSCLHRPSAPAPVSVIQPLPHGHNKILGPPQLTKVTKAQGGKEPSQGPTVHQLLCSQPLSSRG